MLFLSDISDNAEFGYKQAFSSTFKALRNRNATGQTLGQIGSKFGNKFVNATKGKVAGIGRGLKRIGQTISGNSGTGKLSNRQVKKASSAINKSGGRKLTKTGSFIPSNNLKTGKSQRQTKNTFVT